MHRERLSYLTFVLLVSIVTLWGCPKKAEVAATPEAQRQAQTEKVSPSATPALSTEATTTIAKSTAITEGLKSIYFVSHKSTMIDDAVAAMKANAEWLKANPKAIIKIEGNCDERENNWALGQRRASSAKRYLTNMGISAHRISLVSYGKKRPICNEHEESCWQKNRRDDFVVVSQ